MEQLTRTLAGVMRALARGLPGERRQWAEAVQAEAYMVPAGRQRLRWLIGGLWLVMREGHMTRKAVYWIGVCAIAIAAGWAIWLSWRAAPAADSEAMTDRARILVGASALLVLPHLGRRQGWFGPVGNGIVARVVRLVACAIICAIGIELVRADSHAGNNGIGSGRFSWPHEITGIALLGAAVAAPRIVRTWWPKAETEIPRAAAAVAGVFAFLVVPVQTIFVVYIAAVLAATARRSPVSPMALAAGTGFGLAAAGIIYGIASIPNGDQYAALFLLLVLPGISFLMAAFAGGAAAWRVTEVESPQELRQARIRQGLFAGLVAGGAAGLFFELPFVGLGVMMVIGPLAGVGGGAVGAAIAADHLLRSRPDGFKAVGLFVADS